MAANATDRSRSPPHARIDRQSAGESLDCTPTLLYLTRIAVLEARVTGLEATVERKERERQHVVDRYERLLQRRSVRHGEQTTDSRPASPEGAGLLERLPTLFG